MKFLDLVKNRRSIRAFDSERKIPREVIEYILQAGQAAPSANNQQPWEFLIIESREYLAKVQESYPRNWLAQAPAVLVVKGSYSHCWQRQADGYRSLETDLTIAMDHMILAAAEQGIGTCWIAAFDPFKLTEALDLSEDERVFAITPLGYPADSGKPAGNSRRKDLDQIVRYL